MQKELSKKIKERKRYLRSPDIEAPKSSNVEMIDDLLERKPLMEFKGDLIFKAEDIQAIRMLVVHEGGRQALCLLRSE